MNTEPSNEVVYRTALENIENFTHTCIAHPEFLNEHFIRVAMKDIELCAHVALAEVQ